MHGGGGGAELDVGGLDGPVGVEVVVDVGGQGAGEALGDDAAGAVEELLGLDDDLGTVSCGGGDGLWGEDLCVADELGDVVDDEFVFGSGK
jgi:hypothetical protein